MELVSNKKRNKLLINIENANRIKETCRSLRKLFKKTNHLKINANRIFKEAILNSPSIAKYIKIIRVFNIRN